MSNLMAGVIVFLFLNIAIVCVRVWRGPTAPDRMLGALSFGTTATAVLLLMSEVMGEPLIRDAAIVLSLLAAISTIVFVGRWRDVVGHGIIVQERKRT